MSSEPTEQPVTSGGGISTLIPYRNVTALTGYYLSFASLIPVLGLLLGPIAIILGIVGIVYSCNHPEAKGTVHAIVAIILGLIGFFIMAPIGLFLLWALSQ